MLIMTKKIKQIYKIKSNPKSVKFNDLITLLEEYGFELKRVSGSHHIYNREEITFPIPVHNNRVKEIYVKRVLSLIEKFEDK